MSFGEKLKICRVARNLTQPDLAALVGSTKQVISNYEKGLRVPKVVAAAKLASVLDVPVNYLVNDCINIRLWESEDCLEDYWLASPSVDQQYDNVVIAADGEFYAATVAEAEAAGFRRAYRWHGSQQAKS